MGKLTNGKFSITYQSSCEYLEDVETITSEIAAEIGFNESDSDDLSIAITELFNNAIHHGNENDSIKRVHLYYEFKKKTLLVRVRDEGKGFKPENIKNPLAPENLLAESGRGIYLVKTLMDHIDFHFDESGSEITITKNL